MDHIVVIAKFLEANQQLLMERYGEKKAVEFMMRISDGMLESDASIKTVEELGTGKRCLIISERPDGHVVIFSNITGH